MGWGGGGGQSAHLSCAACPAAAGIYIDLGRRRDPPRYAKLSGFQATRLGDHWQLLERLQLPTCNMLVSHAHEPHVRTVRVLGPHLARGISEPAEHQW